jgi:hypothetical protein
MSPGLLRGKSADPAAARLPSLLGMKLSMLEVLTWMLVALGLVLRILEYADDRNLYLDEKSLLDNLVALPVTDFHTVLTEFQIAPPGFLILERAIVRLPVRVVPAARFVPLLCGLASVFLMRSVARRYLVPRAVPIAVGLFALDDWLLYYSAEIKQYSCELLLTLVALLLVAGPSASTEGAPAPWRRWLAGFGVVGVWFSFPLTLVLAGIGTYLIAEAALRRQWQRALGFAAMSLAWAASFALCYVLSHRILSKERFIWLWWDFAFLPLPPRSLAALKNECWQLLNVLNSPAGVLTPFGVIVSAFLALGLFAAGAVALARRWKAGLYLLLAPILFAILASGLRQYPFHGRLLIFLVPSIHLLVAEGAAALGRSGGAPLTFVLGAFLLVQPALDQLWYRMVAARERGHYDSHGDLKWDLLDYLEDPNRVERIRLLLNEPPRRSRRSSP